MTAPLTAASDLDHDPGVSPRAGRGPWFAVLAAAAAGLVFTSIQIVEKIAILKNPSTTLVCDVNSVMSCTDVLNAWQSSVLGPPNALIGAVMFTLLGSGALGAVMGNRLSNAYLATLWGLAVFFLSFASWFMYQTAFSIGRLCLWCTGIVTAVVIICAALTRLAERQRAFGTGAAGRVLHRAVHSGLDLLIWLGWWLAIAALLVAGLAF